MTAQHHHTSSCALVRAASKEMKWWPPALGDTSRLDLHVSYGQIGKCFHFLFLKAPQALSLGERGRAGEFVACFLLLLSAVGTHDQVSRHKVSESEMLSLKCPISAATALLSKAFVAIDLYFISQTCSCRQQNFQAVPWHPGRTQAAHCSLYAIPQGSAWLYLAPAAVVDGVQEDRFNSC